MLVQERGRVQGPGGPAARAVLRRRGDLCLNSSASRRWKLGVVWVEEARDRRPGVAWRRLGAHAVGRLGSGGQRERLGQEARQAKF